MTFQNRHTLVTQNAPLALGVALCAVPDRMQRTTIRHRVGAAPGRTQPSASDPLPGLSKAVLPLRVSPLSTIRRGAHLKNWTPPHVLSLSEPEPQDH